jgi:hypothetical protein
MDRECRVSSGWTVDPLFEQRLHRRASLFGSPTRALGAPNAADLSIAVQMRSIARMEGKCGRILTNRRRTCFGAFRSEEHLECGR